MSDQDTFQQEKHSFAVDGHSLWSVPDSPLQPITSIVDWTHFFDECPLTDFDETELRRIQTGWLNRLKVLRCARPGDSLLPSKDTIEQFTHYLVQSQRTEDRPYVGRGCWSLLANTRVPNEVAIDFIYIPSYIAVAWLCLVNREYPSVATSVDGFNAAMRQGLRFIGNRSFKGSGFDTNKQTLEAIEILALGKVFSHLREHPGQAKQLQNVLPDVYARIRLDMPQEGRFLATSALRRNRALSLLQGEDSNDDLVCSPIYQRWHLWQRRYYVGHIAQLNATAIHDVIQTAFMRWLDESQTQFRADFENAKPKYTVFNHRARQVTTDPRSFQCDIDLAALVDETLQHNPELPDWLPMTDGRDIIEEALRVQDQYLHQTMDAALGEIDLFAADEFNLSVDSVEIQRDPANSDTMTIKVVASG